MLRKSILCFLLCGAVWVFSACAAPLPSASGGLYYGEMPEPAAEATPEPRPNYDAEVTDDFRINPANVYALDEPLEQDGLRFEHVQVRTVKELPDDIVAENFKYFHYGDETDADGKLLGAASYLFLDMEVTNTSDTELSFTWNSMYILSTSSEGVVDDSITHTPREMRYRSGEDLDPEAKDFYRQVLAPGEAVQVTLGFVIEDKYVGSPNFYFTPGNALAAGTYNTWKNFRLYAAN